MVSIGGNRGARYGAVLVICFVLLSAVVGPITIPTAAAQGQNQSQRHTLVIIHVSGSPSWTVTASGSIRLDKKATESTDSIAGKTADGSVGGLPWEENASDPRDVIYFTGELLQFDLGGTGKAQVKLDGKLINEKSLKNTPVQTTTPSPTVTSTPPPTVTPTTTVAPTQPTSSSTSTSGGIGSGFPFTFVFALAAMVIGAVVLLVLR